MLLSKFFELDTITKIMRKFMIQNTYGMLKDLYQNRCKIETVQMPSIETDEATGIFL